MFIHIIVFPFANLLGKPWSEVCHNYKVQPENTSFKELINEMTAENTTSTKLQRTNIYELQ